MKYLTLFLCLFIIGCYTESSDRPPTEAQLPTSTQEPRSTFGMGSSREEVIKAFQMQPTSNEPESDTTYGLLEFNTQTFSGLSSVFFLKEVVVGWRNVPPELLRE